MANRIRPLRRTGAAGVPVVANMLDGEIAVNAFDKKIYMRVGSNLIEIANASGGDWNTLANRPANLISWGTIAPTSKLDAAFGKGQGVLEMENAYPAIDNSSFEQRYFTARANGAGLPGYGFHKAGEYGWFLYAAITSFRARRNDGMDMRFLTEDPDGRYQLRDANSQSLRTQPRQFVQSGDPGAAASPGDLWFQPV